MSHLHQRGLCREPERVARSLLDSVSLGKSNKEETAYADDNGLRSDFDFDDNYQLQGNHENKKSWSCYMFKQFMIYGLITCLIAVVLNDHFALNQTKRQITLQGSEL